MLPWSHGAQIATSIPHRAHRKSRNPASWLAGDSGGKKLVPLIAANDADPQNNGQDREK
jgi:hypothetical protein